MAKTRPVRVRHMRASGVMGVMPQYTLAPPTHSESGQAAVEAALTLPLFMFMILGVLQLFLMLQGRVMAEYAVYRAVRAGSVNHGDCEAMKHAAILSLTPTF